MDLLRSMLIASWQIWVLMAPYLLFGFVAAGVVSVLLSPAWVRRHMGRNHLWQVVKAALMGVPLPLCSCGVLPVALSLRKQGASRGATASFLASTPQTGIDSIWATVALLGPVVAVFRVAAAVVSGVLAGGLVAWAYSTEKPEPDAEEALGGCCCEKRMPVWRRMVRYGCVTLPRDAARPLLLGVLVSGVLTVLVPAGALQGHLANGWQAYGIALLIGVPLYVCSTGSIPMAASFIHMGASPGAAMVFLIAGPATNSAMLAMMWARIGKMGAGLYLLAISVTAVVFGWLLDRFFPAMLAKVPLLSESCAACGINGWGIAAALILLIMMVPGLRRSKE